MKSESGRETEAQEQPTSKELNRCSALSPDSLPSPHSRELPYLGPACLGFCKLRGQDYRMLLFQPNDVGRARPGGAEKAACEGESPLAQVDESFLSALHRPSLRDTIWHCCLVQ